MDARSKINSYKRDSKWKNRKNEIWIWSIGLKNKGFIRILFIWNRTLSQQLISRIKWDY